MRIFKYFIPICSLVLVIISCEKDVNLLDENTKSVSLDSENSANIKVIDVFAGNTPVLPTAPSSLYTGPQVFIYANGAKLNGSALGYINGTQYTSLTTPTVPTAQGQPFPISSVYANIPFGNIRFDIVNARLNLAVVPNVPAPIKGDTLLTFNATLEKGKFYSFYMGDTVPNVRVTVKEDNLTLPEYQTYKIRLANFLMNNPTDIITLYSRRQQAEIITGITHKNVSDWVQLPLPVLSDTLEIRQTGSPLTYITVQAVGVITPGFAPVGLRMYTVIARGKSNVVGKAPSASIIINR
jgi:hypothetical protein